MTAGTITSGQTPAVRRGPWTGPRSPYFLALVISAACVVPAALDGLQTYLQGTIGNARPTVWRAVAFQSGEWIIFGALTPITIFLARRLPLRAPHLWRNVALHFLGALLLCIGWATAGQTLRWLLGMEMWASTRREELASWLLTSLPWSVFMYFAVLGSVHGVYALLDAREREAQAARLEAQLAEARLRALRMQIHPHFLFNSLNAIAVLVRDQDTRAAGRMLELLSDVLRQVLRADGLAEVALADELHFIERYLEIERVRFSDRLRVSVDVSPGVEQALVPSLILQPLVENALRHGIARSSGAGRVRIVARRDGETLVLSVADDGIGVAAAADSAGFGLRNVRERLATMYGPPPRARLELAAPNEGGTVATLVLPYRRSAAPAQRGGSMLTDTTADA